MRRLDITLCPPSFIVLLAGKPEFQPRATTLKATSTYFHKLTLDLKLLRLGGES
jgi:hypothetical protein